MKRNILAGLCVLVAFGGVFMTPAVRALDVSETHPLFVFTTPVPADNTPQSFSATLQNAWTALPEFYQAHAAITVPHIDAPLPERSEWTNANLAQLKSAGIPLAVSIANGSRKQYFLPDFVENLLNANPTIEALVVENFQFDTQNVNGDLDPQGTDPHIEWLKYIVTVVAKQNKKIIIRLDEINPILFTSNPAYKSLYDTLLANRDSVVLVYVQGGPHTILGNSALMGLWLEGAIGQWGIAMDSTAYSKAGFIKPGQFGATSPDSTTPAPSSNLYRAWLLNGAMIGASTYYFDNSDELWAGTQTRFWGQAIAPTLLELVQKGYIVRGDLAKRSAPVGYRVKPATTWTQFEENLVDLDPVFYQGRMIAAAYGVELPGQIPEWIPNTGRHYYIPILSPYASEDVLFSFEEVMMPGAVLTTTAWTDRLNGYYKADGTGAAFIKKVGRAFFIFNTRENIDEEQSYSLPDVPAPMHDISATREGTTITITWPFREGDVSYNVYRVVDPNLDAMHAAEFIEIARNVDTRTFLDEGIAPGETVVYSVTTLTNESAPVTGTVAYGEYKVISAVESRRDGFALVEPYTMRSRTVNGIPDPPSLATEAHSWRVAPDSTEDHVIRAAEAISTMLDEFAARYKNEDLDGLMNLISDAYTDEAGTSKPVLRDLVETLFALFKAGPVHRQIRSWNLNDFEFSGEIIVNCYMELSALEIDDTLVPHPVRAMPRTGTREFEITFYEHHDGSWKIKKTNPPLLRVRDIATR